MNWLKGKIIDTHIYNDQVRTCNLLNIDAMLWGLDSDLEAVLYQITSQELEFPLARSFQHTVRSVLYELA